MIGNEGKIMDTAKSILEKALQMKPSDKYSIIEGLLNSLDEPDLTIDEIWAIETEKRLHAYKNGKLKTLSYEEVFEEEE
jgi:putative addiction module component (TIGR02574 family)